MVALLLAMYGGGLTDPVTAADPAVLALADPQRAEPLTKKCSKCHGDEGISDDPGVPQLVGQSPTYLFAQLQAFKADVRGGGRMNKTAKKPNDQEMADLVTLFASRTLPEEQGVVAPEAPGLLKNGDRGRDIKPCTDCHGEDGRGKRDKHDAPTLAGMPLLYFTTAMQGFRDGSRASDPDGVMGKAAKGLNDQEIDTLAPYYLALGKRKPLPAS